MRRVAAVASASWVFALSLLPSEGRTQQINGHPVVTGIAIIRDGRGRAGVEVNQHASGLPPLPDNISLASPPPLVVDHEWVFDSPTVSIEWPGLIVFRPGGKITLHGGGTLRIRARSLRATDGDARIRIEANGDAGSQGAKGRDGNGGDGGRCRDKPVAKDPDGHPSWPTTDDGDFDRANKACDHNDGCDFGVRGDDAPPGKKGGSVELVLDAPARGPLEVSVQGGPPGIPGKGGLGMRHYLMDKKGHWRGNPHPCPDGGDGNANGVRGPEGTCTVKVGRRSPRPC